MARVPHLTAAEFDILKVLWRLELATVAEVRAAQTKRGAAPAYTTVMTLLGRLAAKGAVLVDRSREPYVYRAAHRRESVIGSRVRAFLQDVFDGRADSLVLHLVEDEALSLDSLRAIERGIRQAELAEETPEPSEAAATSSATPGGEPRGARRKRGQRGSAVEDSGPARGARGGKAR